MQVIVNLCLRAQWPLGTATDAESNTSWSVAPATKWSTGWQVASFFLIGHYNIQRGKVQFLRADQKKKTFCHKFCSIFRLIQFQFQFGHASRKEVYFGYGPPRMPVTTRIMNHSQLLNLHL